MPDLATVRAEHGHGGTVIVLVCSLCHRRDLIARAQDDGIIRAWAEERSRVGLGDLAAAADHHYRQAGHPA